MAQWATEILLAVSKPFRYFKPIVFYANRSIHFLTFNPTPTIITYNPEAAACSAIGFQCLSGIPPCLELRVSSAIPLPVGVKIAGLGTDIMRSITFPHPHVCGVSRSCLGSKRSCLSLVQSQRYSYIGINLSLSISDKGS